MRFEIRPPHVIYHDEVPGSYVACSVNGVLLTLDDLASSFNDAAKRYAWAFRGSVKDGDRLVFSHSARRYEHVVGAAQAAERPVYLAAPGDIRILVGAGSDAPKWSKEGWYCNDIAEAAVIYEGITLVGPCWALPVETDSVSEIMARGMIEHMTYHEVERAFKEWMRALKPGGFFTGEVPDADEYIREYLKMRADPPGTHPEGTSFAEGEPDDNAACSGIERWLRRALYGWQRWPGDEHRSGWDERLFRHYLERCGGSRVEVRHMSDSFDVDDPKSRVHHLWARVWK